LLVVNMMLTALIRPAEAGQPFPRGGMAPLPAGGPAE
jgi:cytochrome c oxidase cbb3-type subunit 1